MKQHIPILFASISLFIFLWFVGIFFEITNVIPAGLGSFVAFSSYVGIWYYFLRKNKPVWQPGRRFWLRWLVLSLCAAGVLILELGFSFLIFISLLGIANIVLFFYDAYRNFSDVSINYPVKKNDQN